MFYDNFVRLCNSVNKSPSSVAEELGLSRASVNGWKKGKQPTDANQQRIAGYFGISVDELMGKKNKPIFKDEGRLAEKTDISDDDIKFALFGGGPVTDEQFAEVKQFVRFIKERDANGGKR